MRVGIFAEPHSYTALIRLSNGGPIDDTKPAVHAMAIKVLVPNGDALPHQQDFIVADHPVFFARNVQHMFEFVDGMVHGALDRAKYPKLDGFSAVAKETLLRMTYWRSNTLQTWSGAVKYFVTPSQQEEAPQIDLSTSPDFLREAMIEQLTHLKIGAHYAGALVSDY